MRLPEKFEKNMQKLLGDKEYNAYIKSFDEKPTTALRINPLKTWVDFSYENFNLRKVPWCENGYYYENENAGKNIFHDCGLYYIQDASAMSVVELLSPKPHEKVLDLCAAPGGKSTQIAEKMQNTGLLVSNEIVPNRAKILSYNIERMGITNALVLNENPEKISEHLPEFFDKILVDAPCSGEGMFRKNNDAINEWEKSDIYSCATRQLNILESASKCLKNGGILAFSTCTFNTIENEGVVLDFLKSHSEFSLISPETKYKDFSSGIQGENISKEDFEKYNLSKCVRLFPHKIEGEGHFIAIMKKDENANIEYKNIKSNLNKNHTLLVNKWAKKNNYSIDNDNLYAFGDNIYILPEFLINVKNIKVLRYGLQFGEINKDRFTPSHSLALAIKNRFDNQINVDEITLNKYLRGETFETSADNGWALISYKNLPIGWGKVVNNIVKNFYPKGLRK